MPPKESFKAIAEMIRGFHSSKSPLLILDIGCANGAFPKYLQDLFSDSTVSGMEYLPELVAKSQISYPYIRFFEGSILDAPKNEEM